MPVAPPRMAQTPAARVAPDSPADDSRARAANDACARTTSGAARAADAPTIVRRTGRQYDASALRIEVRAASPSSCRSPASSPSSNSPTRDHLRIVPALQLEDISVDDDTVLAHAAVGAHGRDRALRSTHSRKRDPRVQRPPRSPTDLAQGLTRERRR